jgi:ABC-2 type transport system ATP-binding protein
MGVPVIQVEDLTKRFHIRSQKSLKELLINARRDKAHESRFTALDSINLSVDAGESIGLVGPNGSGKSTLLKVIGGILAPDSGRVLTRGRIAALLELGAGFHPDLTGRENVFLNGSILGLTKQETTKYFDDIVEFSGIKDFIDTQVKFYSSGMYVRLAFAVAVHIDPDILLVDEVLAVGDEPFQVRCMEKISQFQQEGRTIVLVSHSASQVAQVCDRAVVLEKGRLVEDSAPDVSLARLRREYQRQIDATMEAEAAERTDQAARITGVWLNGTQASSRLAGPQVKIEPGTDLRLRCQVQFPAPVPGWFLHFKIESLLGVTHCEISSRDSLRLTMPEQQVVDVDLLLPNLMLGDGEYSISVMVFDAHAILLDVQSRSATFAVKSAGHSYGAVYCDASLSFNQP